MFPSWRDQRLNVILALVLEGSLMLGPFWAVRAANPGPEVRPEARVEGEARANFLVAFAKYTLWPDDALAPVGGAFVVGVLGDDALGTALNAIQGLQIQGHRVVVKRFGAPSEIQGCHVLYFPKDQEWHFSVLKESLARQSVLTVGETQRFCDIGGALYLFNEGGRLRFIVNLETLKQAHLSVEARALSLAKRTIGKRL